MHIFIGMSGSRHLYCISLKKSTSHEWLQRGLLLGAACGRGSAARPVAFVSHPGRRTLAAALSAQEREGC
jgi:hypothetical protein